VHVFELILASNATFSTSELGFSSFFYFSISFPGSFFNATLPLGRIIFILFPTLFFDASCEVLLF